MKIVYVTQELWEQMFPKGEPAPLQDGTTMPHLGAVEVLFILEGSPMDTREATA